MMARTHTSADMWPGLLAGLASRTHAPTDGRGDLTMFEVDFAATGATVDHPVGRFEASRDPSTFYDGGHTVLPAMARVFSLLKALSGILTPSALEAGGPSQL